MNPSESLCRPFQRPAHLLSAIKFAPSGKLKPITSVLALAAIALGFTAVPVAKADSYTFSLNGSGITASGVITVANTGPLGASTVTGITGTFADSNNGFGGAITGLEYAPAPTFNAPPAPPNTFGAPAFTDSGFSYDNLFWPGADSPAVCKDALAFFGGFWDVYGMAFDVTGGYKVDVWSDGLLGGYQVGDSLNGTKLSPDVIDGVGYSVDASASPVPEPGSWMLLGSGLPGVLALMKRRRSIS